MTEQNSHDWLGRYACRESNKKIVQTKCTLGYGRETTLMYYNLTSDWNTKIIMNFFSVSLISSDSFWSKWIPFTFGWLHSVCCIKIAQFFFFFLVLLLPILFMLTCFMSLKLAETCTWHFWVTVRTKLKYNDPADTPLITYIGIMSRHTKLNCSTWIVA